MDSMNGAGSVLGPSTSAATEGGQQYMYQPQFVQGEEAKGIILANYTEQEIAQVALDQMNEMSRRAHDAGMTFGTSPRQITASTVHEDGQVSQSIPPYQVQQPPMLVGLSAEAAMQRLEELQRARAAAVTTSHPLTTDSSTTNGNLTSTSFAPPPHPPPGVAPLVNSASEQAQGHAQVRT